MVEFAAAAIYLLHDRQELDRHPPPARCNVIVTGHSHKRSWSGATACCI